MHVCVWHRWTDRCLDNACVWRHRRGAGVCEAVQVGAGLMLMCLMKRGEPMREKFRSCVSGTGGSGKGFIHLHTETWTSTRWVHVLTMGGLRGYYLQRWCLMLVWGSVACWCSCNGSRHHLVSPRVQIKSLLKNLQMLEKQISGCLIHLKDKTCINHWSFVLVKSAVLCFTSSSSCCWYFTELPLCFVVFMYLCSSWPPLESNSF